MTPATTDLPPSRPGMRESYLAYSEEGFRVGYSGVRQFDAVK